MTTELTLLGWTLVLALVQIMLHAYARNAETGLHYNAGPRDGGTPPPGKLSGRLERARNNLLETLPLFATAILIAHVADQNSTLTFYGAWAYLLARIAYVPLYAYGVPYLRSIIWAISLGGLISVLLAILS